MSLMRWPGICPHDMKSILREALPLAEGHLRERGRW